MTGGEDDRGGVIPPGLFLPEGPGMQGMRRCIMGEKDKMLQKKASIIPMLGLALWKKLY